MVIARERGYCCCRTSTVLENVSAAPVYGHKGLALEEPDFLHSA